MSYEQGYLSISKYWNKAHFGGAIGVEDALHEYSENILII